jgi:hypothetical protein
MSELRLFGTSGRQRLVSGVIALVLATACILSLTVLQTDGVVGGSLVGLLTVALFVYGTVSIGTSEQIQV